MVCVPCPDACNVSADAPAAKLEVIEFSLRQRETDHEPQHRFRIRITGQLQSMQQSLNEDAVYTQYFQELLQP